MTTNPMTRVVLTSRSREMSRPGGKEALSSILGGRALDVAGRGGSWRGVVGSSRGVSQEEEEGSHEEGREITTSFRESLMGDTCMERASVGAVQTKLYEQEEL